MIRISFRLNAPDRSTDVYIRPEFLKEIAALLPNKSRLTSVLIVTDSNVGPLYGDGMQNSLLESGLKADMFTFAAGEHSKKLQTVTDIYAFLSQHRFGRDGLIIALGGGVVGDLAGFVAGTWMRGVPWVYCPTTLEADIDACLGGKTAVNLAGGKNLVGVFHHPTFVAVDPNCLCTLPERDVRAGLAEAIKHAILQSTQEVEWLETNAVGILALHPDVVSEFIERNLRFKGQIVSEDPYERLERRIILNFGHTIGHAIETCANGTLRHGECVSLGMLAASRISHRAGLLGSGELDRIQNLLTLFRLPTKLKPLWDREKVLETLLLDKKNSGRKTRFVLLNGIGTPMIREDIPTDWITEAYDSLLIT